MDNYVMTTKDYIITAFFIVVGVTNYVWHMHIKPRFHPTKDYPYYRSLHLFDFGRNNRVTVTPIYDDDYGIPGASHKPLYWWINGRVFGYYLRIKTLGERRYRKTHPETSGKDPS